MKSLQVENSQHLERICERYRQLYAGAVYDVLEHLGYPNQVLTHNLAPLAPDMRLAGPALSVEGATTFGGTQEQPKPRPKNIKEKTRPPPDAPDLRTPVPAALCR